MRASEATTEAVTEAVTGPRSATKELDLDATIYDLTETYPELIDILKELGFFGVARPAVRTTLGRVTTLAQGCERQGKNLGEVIAALEQHGFTLKASA